MNRRLRKILPSAVTLLGHGLTLLWLAGGPFWLALLALLCDAADGLVARHLSACTEAGGLYDFLVDTSTAALIAASYSLVLLLVLVPLQATLRARGLRFSGRAALTVVALVWGSPA